MKKILVTLLVLALCTPAMAATIDVVGSAGGTATVTITADGAANLVGLGLDVDVDAGAVTAVSVDTPNFDINPDAAYTLELGAGYGYGDGTPVAAKTVPGQIDLPQSSFALSFGNLNGSATAGADGAASVQVTITVSEACTLTVCENATRGGIVAVDGSSLDAACDSDAITITPTVCVKDTAAFYADWVSFGSPDCWCYRKQCNGDADGVFQGNLKTGLLAVYTNDLTILSNAYNIAEPPQGVGVDSVGICADFDHLAQGNLKTGLLRVYTNDLTILSNNYNVVDPGVADCSMADYNFWTN